MKKHIIVSLILSMFFLFSCSQKSLMSYYYPTKNNTPTKVYKYVNPENHELDEYWMVSFDPAANKLKTSSYRANFELYNVFEEVVNDIEAKLVGYTDYREGQKEIGSVIFKSKVYTMDKEQSYSYAVKYKDEWGAYIFEKTRKFDSFVHIVIKDKTYKTAKFKDSYSITDLDEEGDFRYEQITYYAKGIGMVKYERKTRKGGVKILELEDILTQEEFEKLEGMKL